MWSGWKQVNVFARRSKQVYLEVKNKSERTLNVVISPHCTLKLFTCITKPTVSMVGQAEPETESVNFDECLKEFG